VNKEETNKNNLTDWRDYSFKMTTFVPV